MIPVRLIAPVLTMLVLGACSSKTELQCRGGTQYREAESTGTLRIPDDLSVPDESDSLRIPGAPLPAPESAEAASACLEESPAFSSEPQP